MNTREARRPFFRHPYQNMKTTKSLVILASASLWLTGCRTPEVRARKTDKVVPHDQTPAITGEAQVASSSATVGAQIGRFYFPIKDISRQWQWQAVGANQLEFKWAVVFQLEDESYQVGYSRFCFRPKGKSVGTFEELLDSGQVDVWKMNADGGASLEQKFTRVTAKRQGDGLLIHLSEPTLLAKLLARRPATVRFESIYAAGAPLREEVRVSYQ